RHFNGFLHYPDKIVRGLTPSFIPLSPRGIAMSTRNTDLSDYEQREAAGIGHNGGPPFEPMAPLAVTIAEACRVSGLGATKIWGLGAEGRLKLIRPDGCRRTLVDYRSLVEFLTPSTEAPRRKRGRPRKTEQQAQPTALTPSPPRRKPGRPRKQRSVAIEA